METIEDLKRRIKQLEYENDMLIDKVAKYILSEAKEEVNQEKIDDELEVVECE